MANRTRDGELPNCDTGPGSRLLFVVRELRDAWTARCRRRAQLSTDTADDTGNDTEPAGTATPTGSVEPGAT